MPRRLLSRHIRPRPLDDREIKHYLRVYDARGLYHHPEIFPRLCSQQLFDNSAPLELEVGCGTAEFLCSLASKEPEVNFVGVDIARRPLYKAVEVASLLQLTNVRFLHANFAQMYPLLEPCSLRQVYVHFPDPNTRPKFHRRKLVTPAFLEVRTAKRQVVPCRRNGKHLSKAPAFLARRRMSTSQSRPSRKIPLPRRSGRSKRCRWP